MGKRYAALMKSLISKDCQYLLETVEYDGSKYGGRLICDYYLHDKLHVQYWHAHATLNFNSDFLIYTLYEGKCTNIQLIAGPPNLVPEQEIQQLFGKICCLEYRFLDIRYYRISWSSFFSTSIYELL